MAYPYYYSTAKKGILCFDPNQSDMKMTVTGCCPSQKPEFEDGKIFIGGKCYGADSSGDLQGLKNGDNVKLASRKSGGKQPEPVEALL